jgi:hypothetical protein
MVNIPTLPTDNFYKFMTVSGLSILIFSFFAVDFAVEKLLKGNQEFAKNNRAISEDVSEFGTLQNEVLYYNEVLKNWGKPDELNVVDSIFRADTSVHPILNEIVKIRLRQIDTTPELMKKRLSVTMDKLTQISPKFFSANTNLKDAGRRIDLITLNNLRYISYSPFILGLVVLTLGLFGWYRKHQVLQDKILNNQLAESQKSVTAPSSSTDTNTHPSSLPSADNDIDPTPPL